MNPRLRIAWIALLVLIAAALIGVCSGSRRAQPEEAEPRAPLLDVSGFRSVELLPPAQRAPWLDGAQFARPPVPDPRLGAPPAAAAASAAAPAAAATPGARPYRVRENDSFSRIARREYGDEKLARWLQEVNGVRDATKLGIGDLLLLPPAPTAAAGAGAAGAPGSSPAAAAPAAAPAERTWKVKKGETLGAIAQKVYGSTRFADALMKANGLRRAEDLREGQVLSLPQL